MKITSKCDMINVIDPVQIQTLQKHNTILEQMLGLDKWIKLTKKLN